MPPSNGRTLPERTGDPLFGVLAGLYVALLATAPAVVAVARVGSSDSATLYVTAIGTLAVVTGAGWWVVDARNGLAPRLGSTPARWGPAILGVGYAIGGFVALGSAGVVALLAFFFGAFAMVLGGVLGVMARSRHTAALVATADVDCEIEAGWPSAARKRLAVLALPFLLVGAVGLLSIYFRPENWLLSLGQLLLPVGISIFLQSEPRPYVVTAAGLEQRLPVARRLFRWDSFDGYTRTDDALVLHRSWRVDTRFALADLEDPDAVEATIGRYLSAA